MVDSEEEKEAKREKANAKQREYYQKNKERIRAQQQEYQSQNREKINTQNREYQNQNREKINTQKREHYQQNQEEILTHNREYQSQNQEKILTQKREHYQQNREEIRAQQQEYRRQNPEKEKAQQQEYHRKNRAKLTIQKREYKYKKYGQQPMSENKDCPMYLGVHVAERVLSKVFDNVERMPMNNPGFDFICQKGYKIDVKSATIQLTHGGKSKTWQFRTRQNITADYFLCLAFTDRESLEPVHLWLIPSDVVSGRSTLSISPNRLNKWSKYELPAKLDDVKDCCIKMR